MDHTGDRQPPDDDDQDSVPTQIVRANPPAPPEPGYQPGSPEPGYQPGQAAPGYQPTAAGPDYQQTVRGPDYQQTVRGPDYQQTVRGPDHQPTVRGPGYEPTQFPPGYEPGQSPPGYSPTQAAPGYQPGHAEDRQAQAGPSYSQTQPGPSYTPTQAAPPQAGPGYTPTRAAPGQGGPAYTPTQAGPGWDAPGRDVPPSGGATQAGPAYQATQGPGYPPPPPAPQGGRGAQGDQEPEMRRYGPGVPATPPPGASQTAERIWRTGHVEEPVRRPRRWRRLAGTALTVILLAASGVVLYLRFHQAPFHVTAVKITQRTQNGCGVNVTGQISTNGSGGTVHYQWLFQPESAAPQPLSESVVAGQNAVFVTVAVQGTGHGSASRKVTLQVLGPDKLADSTSVVLQC